MNRGNFFGKHHSEETRQKISKTLTGRKGFPHSEEHKKKMSEKFKGRIFTEEWRNKISNSLRGKGGKKHSKETKLKMSEIKMGDKNPFYGKTHTLETKGKWSIQRKGEKHPNWKGGITSTERKIRNSDKYKQWRQDVFIRDGFTCRKCGQIGGKLHAHHHKKPFHKFIEEIKVNLPLLDLFEGAMIYTPLWDITNGITLCKKCHGW